MDILSFRIKEDAKFIDLHYKKENNEEEFTLTLRGPSLHSSILVDGPIRKDLSKDNETNEEDEKMENQDNEIYVNINADSIDSNFIRYTCPYDNEIHNINSRSDLSNRIEIVNSPCSTETKFTHPNVFTYPLGDKRKIVYFAVHINSHTLRTVSSNGVSA
jgi:hypothetical protein